MNTILISYDLPLGTEPRYYTDVSNLIKNNSITWAKPLESVFIISTNKTSFEMRDEIKLITPINSKILVVDIINGSGWATSNISTAVTDWMHKNI